MRNLPLMPEQASTFAWQSDALFFTLLALTLVFTVIVGILIAFFAVRYRRGNRVDRSKPAHHSTVLELSWSIGPLFLALGVFIWAAKLFATMFGPAPANAMDIYVVGKQWMWHMQHANGIRENNEMHVPLGKPVRLTMISQDVIHDLSIPAFRIKRDVIPGVFTSFWFTPTQTGRFHLYCAQYCGTNHSEMDGYVYVMEPTEFQKWLASGGKRVQDTQPLPKTMVEQGAALYTQQGCGNCHDADGMNRGPSLAGLYGKTVPLKNGGTTTADSSYLRKSILESSEEVVDTYQQIMPSYKGQLNEEQVLQVIEYIKSLSAPSVPGQTPAGATPATTGRRASAGSAPQTRAENAQASQATNAPGGNTLAGSPNLDRPTGAAGGRTLRNP
jgi:cytochrome c oxidase subunit 2